MKLKPWHWAILRILIGIIFAYAGISKLLDPIENFRGVLAEYQVLPYAMVPGVAGILPWVEFMAGSLMIAGYAPRMVSAILALLCLGFLIVLIASGKLLTQGAYDCGCFGEGSPIRLNLYQVFVMDFINLLICMGLARQEEHAWSLDKMLK